MPTTKDKHTLAILQSLTPIQNGSDVVTTASRNLLLSCIKSEPAVQCFFPNCVRNPLQDKLDFRTFPLEPLAVNFVAEAICNVKDNFNFHATINKAAVQDALKDLYDSLQWKKLGFQMYTLMYPEVVKDVKSGLSLKDFLNDDSCLWAERLIAHIQEPCWTKRIQQSIIKGQYSEENYNTDMNALFVKLHLLDPQSVIPAYQFLLSQRALPAVNLELATRNYLGGPLDWRDIQFEVENAERKSSPPLNLSRLSLTSQQMEVFHGTLVDDFVVTECRNLGLWSGLRPDNTKITKGRDKCSMM